MMEQKQLRHNQEKQKKPKKLKRLFFRMAVMLAPIFGSSMPACAAHASKPKYPTKAVLTENIQKKNCNTGAEKWLKAGEKILESICLENRDYVLTNTSLLIITKNKKENISSDVTLLSSHSRTETQELLSNGYVAWTASEDNAFFLRPDGILFLIPVAKMGPTLPTYRVPFDVENAKVTYHSELLFIAGENKIMVAWFSDRMRKSIIQFSLETHKREFFESQGKLFFGNEKENIEIMINGREVQLR